MPLSMWLLLYHHCNAPGPLPVNGMTVTSRWGLLGNGPRVLSHYCKQELIGISVLRDPEMHQAQYVVCEPLGKHLLTV